jgi:RNA polymerase sigma-70 factor (ECF subfamily)
MERFASPDESFFTRFRGYLRARARARLDRRLWADVDPSDVVQDALLKAHRSRKQFRGRTERQLVAWLRRILDNTLLNALRSLARHKGEAPVSLGEQSDASSAHPGVVLADGRPLPDDVAARNEQLLRLTRALARLPGDQRRVLELKHLQGLSVAEICEQTGRSKASVVGLLFRGVNALRVLLDGQDSGPGWPAPEGDRGAPAPRGPDAPTRRE